MGFFTKTIAVDKVVAYVCSLEKESGGFGATRQLPATVEDTFHAVTIFKILAERSAQDEPLSRCRTNVALAAYLGRLWPGEALDFKTVFQLFAVAETLETGLDPVPLKAIAKTRLSRKPNLFSCYYAAQILGPEAEPLLVEQLGEQWLDRLLPLRQTSEEMMMALEILQTMRQERQQAALRARLVPWFQECQTPDGGFGFMPGTTSFIENGHFCLRALDRLRAKPLKPEGAADFIASCQASNGGFGRRGRAAPFLDASYHGLAGLSFLEMAGGRWG